MRKIRTSTTAIHCLLGRTPAGQKRRRQSFVEGLEYRAMLSAVPQPAHVVIVMEENHAYSQIIGQTDAPYINSLAQQGALMTNSFAIEHPSQPNYLDLFSGSNQGIDNANAPSGDSGDNLPIQFPGVTLPFTTANLGAELMQAGLSFTSYSESLPSAGYDSLDTSTQGNSGEYARRHPNSTTHPAARIPPGLPPSTICSWDARPIKAAYPIGRASLPR